VIAFEDISKTAKKHYLVCPKQHIKDINSLTKMHLPLLERMNKVAEKLLLASSRV
jgi:diadenosine tetraphosphate (Ap4A) HIT family hydrolase